jgi:hypothetical protein
VLGRERVGGAAQALRPAVGDRREPAVEALAQLADRRRERVVEVAVAAVAEAVAGHVDGGAEAPLVEQGGERGALAGVQQRVGDGEAVGVEAVGESGPVEVFGREHAPTTARTARV